MQVADLRPRLRPRGYAAADAYLARPYDARWCVEGPALAGATDGGRVR